MMIISKEIEVFEDAQLEVVGLGGERWLRGPQIAGALGFKNPSKAISDIYSRNRSEFDDTCTLVIEMPTNSGRQLVRLYNARGAALIAMKANTPKGEAFRRWVLDVLEGKAAADTGPVTPASDMNGTVAYRLRMMFLEAPKMRQLIRHRVQGLNTGEIAKLLDVSRGYVSGQLRVAEYLGLIEQDPKLEVYRAAPQYQKFLKGKADYYQRQKAKKAAAAKALPAPGTGNTGSTGDSGEGQRHD